MSEILPEALLPCPFCGSYARLTESSSGWSVECASNTQTYCDAGLTEHNWTKAAAIEMWNRRDISKITELEKERDDLRAQVRNFMCIPLSSKETLMLLVKAQSEIVRSESWLKQQMEMAQQALKGASNDWQGNDSRRNRRLLGTHGCF